MMQYTLFFFMIIITLIFSFLKHPLAMGLNLLIQTILICLLTGMMTKTYWFSYILFLIFVGGMLVLFIYMTSLASNEMFSFSSKMMFNFSMLTIFFIITIFIIDKNLISFFWSNNDMQSLINYNSFLEENTLMLNKLYNYPTNLITLLLMNYLLITLIAVVKITKMFFGPLRQMN